MTRVRSTNSKAEECTTPRIGSRNIKQIQIGVGRWPRIEDSYCCCYSCRVPAILCEPVTLSSLRSVGIHQEWQQVTGKLLLHSIPSLFLRHYWLPYNPPVPTFILIASLELYSPLLYKILQKKFSACAKLHVKNEWRSFLQ